MVKSTETATAHLTEVFSSVQGEGPYVGVRQIFVRFYGCHRRCEFCDSPETVTAWQPAGFKPSSFRIEMPSGSNQFERHANPVDPSLLTAIIGRLDSPRRLHHSVALTGGEPLLHAEFLGELLPRIEHLGLQTYLETSGDLYHQLEPLLPWLDIAAMDIKLPSVTKNEPAWENHRHFLRRCVENEIDVFAKAIVSGETSEADIRDTARVIADVEPRVLLVLQPLSIHGNAKCPATPAQLLAWQKVALDVVPHVRVIPQCHKMTGHL